MRKCFPAALLMSLVVGSAAYADLLVNEDFGSPPGVPCGGEQSAPSDWTKAGTSRPFARNIGFGGPEPTCEEVIPDGYYATIWWAFENATEAWAYQSVSNLTPGQAYKVSFRWRNLTNMLDANAQITFSVEARDGVNNTSGGVLQSVAETLPGNAGHDFEAKSFVFTASSNSATITWRVRRISGGTGVNFLISHMDYIRLELATCTMPPTIAEAGPITPAYGVRGQTTHVTVNGTNFVNGMSVKLIHGTTEINGTSVAVNGSTSLTADLDIPAGSPPGPYRLEVSSPDALCDPASLNNAFTVVLPTLSNGSFEADVVGECTPATLAPNLPTDWQAFEAGTWGFGNRLNLNGYRDDNGQQNPLPDLPTCPPPDGGQYGTIPTGSGAAGASARAWQTIAVTPNRQYTISGMFAGIGNNTVTLRLLDGLPGEPIIGETVVHTGTGTYDWKPASVTGMPTGNIMTFAWDVVRQGGADNASHADALILEECLSPITVNTLSPTQAINDGVKSITVTGTGFSGTPTVTLISSFGAIPATVTNVTSNQITADVDLTGAPAGRYGVMVKQGGCVASIPSNEVGAMLVIGTQFINGGFEDPTPANAPCSGRIGGMPTGWSTSAPSGLFRDGQEPPPSSCPSPADGHYGSMSEGSGGIVRAWQTVAVQPGMAYEFSGYFEARAAVGITLRLLDGDENGSELAAKQVAHDGSAWVFDSVQAFAPASGIMTVVWELDIPGVLPDVGGHADGLQFVSLCNDPAADFDGDGDVDQEDFGALQTCITGPGGAVAEGCECFDRATPFGEISQADIAAFEACASGPTILADPACDN